MMIPGTSDRRSPGLPMSVPYDRLTSSPTERNIVFTDHHFTGPFAPLIDDELMWADFADHAEDIWSDERV